MEIAMRQVALGLIVPDDAQYIAEVEDILQDEAFQSMKENVQHGVTSTLAHSLAVSYLSYKACLRYGLDARAAARGGLLHDYFLYDWHVHLPQKKGLLNMHGFTHPKTAMENANDAFELNDLEREIISHHMWPLTIVPPKNKESYIVIYYDKVCSTRECFGKPVFAG